MISMELLAESLDEEQIANACRLISFAADHWDDELQRTFGGSTFFGNEEAQIGAGAPAPQGSSEVAEEVDEDPGGYL